jgi:hypothetical protein
MFHAMPPIRTQEIKPQAVFLWINLINQPLAENCPLRRINDALKNGILNPLPIIQTRLCYPAQTTLSSVLTGGNIIADKHKHTTLSYFQIKGG